jgi:hypothetical protein
MLTRRNNPSGERRTGGGKRARQITAQFNQFFELTPPKNKKRSAPCPTPNANRWKKPCSPSTNCRRTTRRVHPRLHEIRRHESARPRRFFEKRRTLVAMCRRKTQAWRDLVAHVPEWPPLPQSLIMPPMPPMPPPKKSLPNRGHEQIERRIQFAISAATL